MSKPNGISFSEISKQIDDIITAIKIDELDKKINEIIKDEQSDI